MLTSDTQAVLNSDRSIWKLLLGQFYLQILRETLIESNDSLLSGSSSVAYMHLRAINYGIST